jgi:hypothetical protein
VYFNCSKAKACGNRRNRRIPRRFFYKSTSAGAKTGYERCWAEKGGEGRIENAVVPMLCCYLRQEVRAIYYSFLQHSGKLVRFPAYGNPLPRMAAGCR